MGVYQLKLWWASHRFSNSAEKAAYLRKLREDAADESLGLILSLRGFFIKLGQVRERVRVESKQRTIKTYNP